MAISTQLTLCDVLETEFIELDEFCAKKSPEDIVREAEKKCGSPVSPPYEQLKLDHLKALQVRDALLHLSAENQSRKEAENKCSDAEARRMDRLVQILGTGERAALCFSGGGIRSATFGLGILQGLAHLKLLGEFHYLSTVSGGGYIGSWLSSWRKRESIAAIEATLSNKPARKLDGEIPEIEHLRSYSNYLSPQTGALSADSWTLGATILRNMFLNWLVLVPILAAALLVPRLALAMTRHIAAYPLLAVLCLVAGSLLAILGVVQIGKCLPSLGNAECSQKRYWGRVLAPIALSASLISIFWVGWVLTTGRPLETRSYLMFGGVLHLLGWVLTNLPLLRANFLRGLPRLFFAALSGALGGWVAAELASLSIFDPKANLELVVCIVFPTIMIIYFLATALFIGLNSATTSDEDREWWARSGAWILILGFGWMAASGLVIEGPILIQWAGASLAASGGVAGMVAGFLGSLGGKSSKTASGKRSDKQKPVNVFSAKWFQKIALRLAPVIFLIVLALAIGELATKILCTQLYRRAFGDSPVDNPFAIFSLIVLAMGLALWMGQSINVNTFSLHAMYRSRLIRAYLGASNPDRLPNLFTGFDKNDDSRMADLPSGRPLHVINMALNLVHGKRLAWQERKAETFTVTRLHAGSARVGYQNSAHYGDTKGISLGTAMAISGAAASPNMGYHSSPLVTFLMTFFNARLGWWLANPGPFGKKHWKERGPRSAVRSLLSEAFGQTDDENRYVYLSDGGHFENLGIYEMVLRRCRTIVAVDAGADPAYQFEDLGNAIRKIRVDLGITIHLDKPLEMRAGIGTSVHCAIGHILYPCVDGNNAKAGTLLYIKPVLEPSLSVDLDQYHSAHTDFPQQPTADQFFDESQFESYRRLGLETIESLCQQPNPSLAVFVTSAQAHSGVNKGSRASC